jgi:copper chaperone
MGRSWTPAKLRPTKLWMIKLKVTGMTCGHCEAAVKKALSAVPGVDEVVSVDRTQEEAVVEGSPELGALVAAIEEEGYTASMKTG